MTNIAEFNYEQMWVLGSLFCTLRNAYELREGFTGDKNYQFSDVKMDGGRKIMDGFTFKPASSLVLVCLPRKLAVICAGCDKVGMKGIIEEVKKRGNLEDLSLDEEFLLHLDKGVKAIHFRNYDLAKNISKLNGYPVENVISAGYYASFLEKFQGLGARESINKAKEKFGIKII